MSLTIDKLLYRGLTVGHVDKAIKYTEEVLNGVIMNASRNTTGAQAMKGNLMQLAADLEVLYAIRASYKEEKPAPKRKPAAEKVEAEEVVSPEADAS